MNCLRSLLFVSLGAIVSACTDPALQTSPVTSELSTSHQPSVPMVVRFKEGVHYKTLDKPFEVAGPELRSFFSYACPHCYVMKSVVDKVRVEHQVSVYESHVPFLRAIGRPSQDRLSAGLQVARNLNVSHQFSDAVFKAFHKEKVSDFSEDAVCSMLASILDKPISDIKNQFKDAMSSPGVHEDVRIASMLLETKQIPGVPVFVVNGKYLIQTKNLSKTDLAKDLADITLYLQQNGK